MAGQSGAQFVSGARAIIKIGGTAMAYAADLSYNITVTTVPVETIGRLEVHANEPVAYTVEGSFSVVRYSKAAIGAAFGVPPAAVSGSPVGTAPGGNLSNNGTFIKGTAPGDHLNPAQILSSQTFDIEIDEKLASGSASVAGNAAPIFKIYDCRMTRRGATLNKRGILVDSYSFVGILAGDIDQDVIDAKGEVHGSGYVDGAQ